MEDFRERTANDRSAALEAKYDPEDEIAARRFGVPVEASAFLDNFTKGLQNKSPGSMGGSGGSKGSMGGSGGSKGYMGGFV